VLAVDAALLHIDVITDLPVSQEALSAYQRAVDLAPSRLIHRVELARTALRLGQVTRAARELQVC
jgi:predicted Zn-dependent protease